MVLPAHLLSSGLGSNVSIWLIPPTRKIQITLLALGENCGLPSGGSQTLASPARATPSSASIFPSTSPVKPMPTSARNARRPHLFPLASGGRKPPGGPNDLFGVVL